MKKLLFILPLLFTFLFSYSQITELEKFLKSQTEIGEINEIKGNQFFRNTYEIKIKQPIDHSDTTLGFFQQRVFVANKSQKNPVVFITEGYGANYASRPNYINELSPILNANQICVEHRYFGQSWPDAVNWDYLTVVNAAADHHRIVRIFKEFYSGKWINTGISKGGQTAVYHRTYYPNDVDATVAYVCPLNFGVEDGRHEPFLRKIPGTKEQRKKIENFQLSVLKNRESILPKLKEYSKEKEFTYRITIDEVLDYCVLEYPFALWQYGRYINEVPDDSATVDELFNHLIKVSGPSYFSVEGMERIKSFFIQAARELGYYGYDTKPFKKLLTINSSKNYLSRIFLPEKIIYQKQTAKEVKKFIKKTNCNILFIYGEFDPWSASAFNVPKKDNFLKIVKPGGSHSTRINNLKETQKSKVKNKLENWLKMEIIRN
ncbi:MAG: S28 family serine protease [Draconibacterium sp.]|nr:S28 family serine protease [Draconibacterium sp.]